jgi:hypothetical protein
MLLWLRVQEGNFDFEEDKGPSTMGRAEVQGLRNELAEMRNFMATTHAPAPQLPTKDPMFPTNTLAEMMSRLKAVETSSSTGDTFAPSMEDAST